jgi:hypothetical protein
MPKYRQTPYHRSRIEGEESMRSNLAGLAVASLFMASASLTPAGWAAARLSPAQIQATFFTGKPFTASTPSNIQFTMVFTPDGKVSRQPLGKSGVKGEGSWKLSKDGFCTTWRGSKASCFTVVAIGDNKWNVLRGPAVVASWSK